MSSPQGESFARKELGLREEATFSQRLPASLTFRTPIQSCPAAGLSFPTKVRWGRLRLLLPPVFLSTKEERPDLAPVRMQAAPPTVMRDPSSNALPAGLYRHRMQVPSLLLPSLGLIYTGPGDGGPSVLVVLQSHAGQHGLLFAGPMLC